jgi:excinuclease UvrABC ATPase subunit
VLGAGHDGGRVVFEGTPAEFMAARSTLTGSTWRRLSAAFVGGGRAEVVASG